MTVCLTSETERVEGSIIRSLANSRDRMRVWLEMGAGMGERGGLSSLSAMPPVAASKVSSGLETYAVDHCMVKLWWMGHT